MGGQLVSDIFHTDPSPRLLSALGALTLNWAAIEAALDFSVAIIFHDHPFNRMDAEVPRALGRKIKFLKDGLYSEKLAPIRTPGRALLADLKSHKDDRNKIVHGALLDAADGDTIKSLRVQYGKSGHSTSVHTVTADEVEGYALAALKLSDRTTAFSVRLFNITRPDQPISYPLGEFAE